MQKCPFVVAPNIDVRAMLMQQLRNLEMLCKQCCCQRTHKPTILGIYMLRLFNSEVLCNVIESIEGGIGKGTMRDTSFDVWPQSKSMSRTVQPETCCIMWFVRIKENLHCVLYA